MNQKQAATVWRTVSGFHLNAVARLLEVGPLSGEHVVEIEPRPSLSTDGFQLLMQLASDRNLELSYGKSPRRVLVLS